MPARGGGGGLINGLSSDDIDEDEYVDEDSEELMAIKNTGNRLGEKQKVSTFWFTLSNRRQRELVSDGLPHKWKRN